MIDKDRKKELNQEGFIPKRVL